MFKHIPKPVITANTRGEKWVGGKLVQYPVSYRYNGGTIYQGEWYEGFEVPSPKVQEGYELIGIGINYQMNARPPLATKLLRKKN